MHNGGGTTSRGGHRRASHRDRAPDRRLLAVVLVAVVAIGAGAWWLTRTPGYPGDDQTVADTPAETATSDTVATVGDDGTLVVTSTLDLRGPVDVLDLSVPEAHGASAETDPRIDGLSAVVDGRAVPVDGTPERGSPARVRLPDGTEQVTLTYRARGVAVRTEPSRPSRALVSLNPVVVEQAGGMPWTLRIDSVKVLNLGCAAGSGELELCGTHSGSEWTVEGSGAGPRQDVLAQMDLPIP